MPSKKLGLCKRSIFSRKKTLTLKNMLAIFLLICFLKFPIFINLLMQFYANISLNPDFIGLFLFIFPSLWFNFLLFFWGGVLLFSILKLTYCSMIDISVTIDTSKYHTETIIEKEKSLSRIKTDV